MKKLLLLSLVMSFSFFGIAQERTQINTSLRNISKTVVFENPTDGAVHMQVNQNPYVVPLRKLQNT